MIVLSKIQSDRTCNLNCELQEGGEKKRYRLKEEYEYCPHSSVQMWRFKGLWAEQMAFYAIIGRLGLCCCTRPARGVQSSTCAGIIVIVCAHRRVVYFISRYIWQTVLMSLCPWNGTTTPTTSGSPGTAWRLHWI